MSTAEPTLDSAAEPFPRNPGMAIALATSAIVLATLKLVWLLWMTPRLIGAFLKNGILEEGMPIEFADQMQPLLAAQLRYVSVQAIFVPLGVMVAGCLIWGATSVLLIRPSGDRLIRRVMIGAAIFAVAATAVDVQFQYASSQFATSMLGFSGSDHGNRQAVEMAFWFAFLFALAWSLGILLLQFGYYVYTYRYFSKPEIRALY